MTGVAHDIPQIQKESLSQVFEALFVKTILKCKQCMACEAEGGTVKADGFKIFPRFLLLLVCKQMGHPAHQKQNISLLDDLVPLESVEANVVIAGTSIKFDLLHIRRFQQMEGFILTESSGSGIVGPFDGIADHCHTACVRSGSLCSAQQGRDHS